MVRNKSRKRNEKEMSKKERIGRVMKGRDKEGRKEE